MGIQALTIRQGDNDWPQGPEPIRRYLLRGDMLLEGERIDTTKLTCVTVRRQGMVRSRRVVSATITVDECQPIGAISKTYLSGEYGPTKTLPAFSTKLT
jgi:hypothetical protein